MAVIERGSQAGDQMYEDAANVAMRVRLTVERLRRRDPRAAQDLQEKCDSIIDAVFVPGATVGEADDAFDVIVGLCVMAESGPGLIH